MKDAFQTTGNSPPSTPIVKFVPSKPASASNRPVQYVTGAKVAPQITSSKGCRARQYDLAFSVSRAIVGGVQ